MFNGRVKLINIIFLVMPSLVMAENNAGRLFGVWSGTVGKQQVVACFNAREYAQGTGSYYYKKYLIPIALKMEVGEGGGNVIRVFEDGGRWELYNIQEDVVGGKWVSGSGEKTLPISMSKVSQPSDVKDDEFDVCGKDVFNQELESKWGINDAVEAAVDGIRYRKIYVNIGRREYLSYPDAGLHMESVRLLGGEKYNEINKSLLGFISVSELFECRRAQLAANGMDGFMTQGVNSISVVGGWLKINLSHQAYCATAHPSVWDTQHTFDIKSGRQENLISWFIGGEKEQLDQRVGSHAPLPTKLAQFIYANIGNGGENHLTKDEFNQCYGEQDPEQYWYGLELMGDGINFVVPYTSNGSCGDNYKVTFNDLAPFLNMRGLAMVKELKRGKRPN